MRHLMAVLVALGLFGFFFGPAAATPKPFPISRGTMVSHCGATADGVVTGGGHSGCTICGKQCVNLDCNNKTGKCDGIVVGKDAPGHRRPVNLGGIRPVAATKRVRGPDRPPVHPASNSAGMASLPALSRESHNHGGRH